jgi:hypothetical protein
VHKDSYIKEDIYQQNITKDIFAERCKEVEISKVQRMNKEQIDTKIKDEI